MDDLFPADKARSHLTRNLIARAVAKERARCHVVIREAERHLLTLLARMTTGDFIDMRDTTHPIVIEIEAAGDALDALRKELERA